MQMTEEEICKRFKRNGCYKEHITILAQLNAVDVIVIEKILSKNGLYDNRRVLRNTR
jgi:predicted RNA binding protein YcfA (HicA-like mRNA interferase family)